VTIRVNARGFNADLNKMMARLSKQMEAHGAKLGQDFNKGLSRTNPDAFFKKVGDSADRAATRVDNASKKMSRSLDDVGMTAIDVGDVVGDVANDIGNSLKKAAGDTDQLGDALNDVKRDADGVADTLDDVGDGAGRAGRGMRGAGGDGNFLSNTFRGLAASADSSRRLLDHIYRSAAFGGSALAGVAGGASAAAQGIFAMASSAAAAAPALSILSNAAIAFAQVGTTISVASKGVGEAITAGFEKATTAATGMGGATASMTSAVESAQRAVRDAKQNLQDAYQDAAQAAADAARRVVDAEQEVANAQREVLAVQRSLNAARKEGLEQLEDIAFAAEDAALAEERARINLEEAFTSLQAVQQLPPDDKVRREAELAFQEADLQLRMAIDRREDADRAQEEASKSGVKGTEAMQDAYAELAQAQESAQDAQEALNDARRAEAEVHQQNARRIRDAQESLADAQDRLADAQRNTASATSDLAKATDEYQAAMDKLSPSQQDFVRLMVASGDRFTEARKKIAQPMFVGLTSALRTILNEGLFDKVVDGLTGTGKVLGTLADEAATAMSTDVFSGRLTAVMDSNNKALLTFGRAGGSLAEILVNLAFAARPLVREFANYWKELLGGIAATQRTKKGMDSLQESIANAGDRAREWFAFFGALRDVIFTLGRAANNAANNFGELDESTKKKGDRKGYIPSLTESLEEFNRSLKKNKEELEGGFGTALENFNALGRALKTVVDPLIALGADKRVGEAMDIIAESSAFDRLGESAGDALPAFAELVVAIADILASLSESGSMVVFFNILTGAADAVGDVLSAMSKINGEVGGVNVSLLGVVGTIAGALAAARLLRGVFKTLASGVLGKGLSSRLATAFTPPKFRKGPNKDAASSGAASGRTFTTALTNSIKAGGKGVGVIIARIFADIRAKSVNARAAGTPIGSGVAQGIIAGLKAGTLLAVKQAATSARAINEAIKKALGVKSPSTLTTRTGRELAAGLALGMKLGTGPAAASAAASGRVIGNAAGSGAATGVAGSSAKVGKSFGVLGKASKGLGFAMRGLGGAFRFALGPLFTIILVIELLMPLFKKLYKENETFRRIVDAVWGGIKRAFEEVGKAFTATVDFFVDGFNWIKDNWPLLLAILTGPIGLAVLAITKHWDKIVGVLKVPYDWVKDNWGIIQDILLFPFIGLPGLIAKHFGDILDYVKGLPGKIGKILNPMWNVITDKLAAAKTATIKKVVEIVVYVGGIPGRIRDKLLNMWDVITDKLREKYEGMKSFFTDTVIPFIKGLPEKFREGLGNLWGGLVDGLKSAAGTVIDKINDWLIDPLNVVLEAFGGNGVDDIKKPPGLATGGWVTGRGGPTQDNQIRRLSVGEYVMPARQSKKLAPALEHMRRTGQLPEFGTGGGFYRGYGPDDLWDDIKDAASKLKEEFNDIVDKIKDGPRIAANWVIDKFEGVLPDNMFTDLMIDGLRWGVNKIWKPDEDVFEAAQLSQSWLSPFRGRYPITQYPNAGHSPPWAVDFGMGTGTPIYSIGAGKVITSHYSTTSGYGNYIKVAHGDGSVSLYAHLKRRFRSVGEAVNTGTPLGLSGATGNVTGPHLHFEIMPGSSTLSELRKRGIFLAQGGVVSPTPGGVLATIAEAGRAERVEPLDSEGFSRRDRKILELIEKLYEQNGQGGGGQTFQVFPSPGMTEMELAHLVSRKVQFVGRKGT
jgi:hypothetical protein